MKNSTSIKSKNNLKSTSSKVIGLCLLVISITQSVTAQQNSTGYRLGIGVGTHLSGNSHGAIFDLTVSLYNGKNHFSAGPCIQKRKQELCGASFRYMRILTGIENLTKEEKEQDAQNESRNIQLFTFAQIQYLKGASLSYNAIKMEEAASKENDFKMDYSNYQLSTAEAFVGFGLMTKINQKLVWTNSIGIGTYYHVDYINGLYQERIAPVLMLGTALRLNYFHH